MTPRLLLLQSACGLDKRIQDVGNPAPDVLSLHVFRRSERWMRRHLAGPELLVNGVRIIADGDGMIALFLGMPARGQFAGKNVGSLRRTNGHSLGDRPCGLLRSLAKDLDDLWRVVELDDDPGTHGIR